MTTEPVPVFPTLEEAVTWVRANHKLSTTYQTNLYAETDGRQVGIYRASNIDGYKEGPMLAWACLTKVKARDIIPNWPRGRSTTAPWPEPCSIAAWLPWLKVSESDYRRFEEDALGDEAYHESQARMMEDWHRTGSMATSALNQFLADASVARGRDMYQVRRGQMHKVAGVE
jgi:hypothetical protein